MSELWGSGELGTQAAAGDDDEEQFQQQSGHDSPPLPAQVPLEENALPATNADEAPGPDEEPGPDPRPTGFAEAMVAVITGVARVESLSRAVVEGAVRQALDGVARDAGTLVESLMTAHGDRAVADWTRADRLGAPRKRRRRAQDEAPQPPHPPQERQLCTATTRAKKPCSKPVRVGTLCSWHAAIEGAKARARDENVNAQQQRAATVADFQARVLEMPPPPPRLSQSMWSFSQQLSQEQE